MIREARRTQNSKQDKIQVVKSQPSVNSLREGQEVIYISKSNRLERYRKEKGRLWVSYMDTDNNYAVNGTLTVDTLNVKSKLTSYKIIAHNFTDDISTSEIFIPWFGISEGTGLSGVSASFLVPYSMTLKKLLIRFSTITSGDRDITFRLKKMDDGDGTTDTVATAVWDHDSSTYSDMGEIAARTLINVKRSHFDNNPKFEVGDNAGISMQAAGSIHSGDITYKVTSVWETEILI